MPYETINLGLQLTVPTTGTTNWGPVLKNTTWTKISSHQHTGAGDGSPLVATSLASNSVLSAKLGKNIALAAAATLTPGGMTQTIDFDLGNNQTLDVSGAPGDVTVSLSNAQAGATYRIWIIQGAAFHDVIYPANVKWPQGQAPILTQTNGAIDLVELYYNGTSFLAQWQADWS